MTLLRFENPALAGVFTDADEAPGQTPGAVAAARRPATETMSVRGTVEKTEVLLFVLLAAAAGTWRVAEAVPAAAMPLLLAGTIGGLVLALATGTEPRRAPVTAAGYALLEGVALGALSFAAEAELPGVVLQATVATFGVLGAMLAAYWLGLLRATATFTRFVVTATGAVAVVYVLDLALLVVGVDVPFLHSGTGLGALVSLVVIGVVALNLVLDFAFVEEGVREGADKQLEWYGAFGLVVTLVWLYVEILLFLLEMAGEGEWDD